MATSSKVHLTPAYQPQFSLPGISTESAEKASELLQKNHEDFHIFFNRSGFHNHIVHHLLTLYALKATPAELQKGYDENASYQRPPEKVDEKVVEDMANAETYKKYLGKERYYHDYLVFFQNEMDKKGWQEVLNEYVFKGDERADDMLVRMYAGFLHPIIHLGFGVEFEQPAIIAEALAQAAVHEVWMGKLFYPAEEQAKITENVHKSIVQLLDDIRNNEPLKASPHWDDGNKIRDGVLKRAPEQMLKYASQFQVTEEDLERRTAEMINATAYFTGAAQHPPHQVKFDFFYMHCINSSIFFPSFLRQTWLSPANKIRLLEWKVRADLALYASRGSADLLLDEITSYKPKAGTDAPLDNVFARARRFPDDGHTSKFIRALANGEKVCRKWEGEDGFVIKGDMWKLLGHMVIDSVEAGYPHWVRNAGMEEAWKDVPLRTASKM
ncbi:hypothetical protein M011DRAFT_411074 [Sporormia fimetaria CBS 119925]|uniref:HypA-like protein n=1 Tax=Sporormia fimetaria CBS 119925 TaxID=1340428 RepID=A0A6A6V0S3_9PLEO|nr:hypothetical protein M011DRAFT_411074 [Sporormia fimetaria CBS 119925]